jgi:hypothetical protein
MAKFMEWPRGWFSGTACERDELEKVILRERRRKGKRRILF